MRDSVSLMSMQLRSEYGGIGVHHGLLLLTLCMCFGACQKPAEEFEVPDWTPVVAAPLVDTRFDLADVLELLSDNADTVPIVELEGGQLAFVYSEQFSGTLAEEWLEIPDVVEAAELVLDTALALAINITPDGAVLPLSDTLISEMIVENPSGALISAIDLAEGNLYFTVESTLGDGVEGQITIPNLLDPMGFPWSAVWTDDMLVDGSFQATEDLAEWRIIPENPNVQDTNLVRAYFDVFVINDGMHTAVPGEALSAEFVMDELVFDRVEGDFGSSNITLEESASTFELFDERFTVSGVDLGQASLTLDITNAFGVEAILDSVDLRAIEGGVVVEELNSTAGPLLVPPASGSQQSPSQVSWTIDETNSNITSMFSVEPRELELAAWVRANPNEVDPAAPNFVDADGYVTAEFSAEIPLALRVGQLDFRDTLGLSLDIEDEVQELDSASLRLILHNGFPFGVEVAITFLDSSGAAVDSLALAPLPVLTTPEVDEDGLPLEEALFVHDFFFDWDRAEVLRSVDRAVLRAWSSSSDATEGTIVRITADQGLGMELGAKLYLRVAQ